tara:strand:- start:1 stop:447 length:447 start_codon:yes stop_codon:yes gene_type:complete
MLETIFGEIIILCAVIGGSCSAVIITRNLFRSSPLHTKERNRFKEYISEIEKENRRLKGKVNQAKQPLSIKEYDESNPMGAISELIAGLEPILPAAVRPFLRNKSILEGAEKLLTEHPDEIKNVLSKLVKNKKDANPQEISDNNEISV